MERVILVKGFCPKVDHSTVFLNDVGDKCLPVIPLAKYEQHVRWARSALLAQGLDEDAVSQVLKELTHPIELDLEKEHYEEQVDFQEYQELGACQTQSSDQDQSMEEVAATNSEEGESSGFPEAKRARRQGDPRYDPLAELYPEEPEQVDPNTLAKIKCKRHDDWIVHCGCRIDESEMTSGGSALDTQGCNLSVAHGYVLVEEPDEEDEDGDPYDEDNKRSKQGKLVCRINPFNMMEYLQLSYEEAFFLVYALGCLSVFRDGEALSILQLWRMFRSAQPNFEITYAAYHYFRSKGWVPKSGIKYGTDLMLYRKGPPFYHASYSVVVERVDESSQGAALRPFTWRSLAALSRTTANVSKELMFSYVIVPSDMTEEDFSSPECLKSLKVQEIIVSRWISSRERTEQEEL
ncbi:tRNA-splicing endonuclease subunit Sen2 isoform X2 [Pangasianodon hypophthalmus]|uniref:tRNA-splicing endonuclease subunit Sen2 isoform X2 n=1 Tax=Pangasianodon hypophthalmus TaxID=310915 RepID=UPI00230824B6|nr:tRNA-splicing endonuclease subunit Sen2 isoform X2 [Pangasianodon hypophthalmus]